MTNFDAGVTDGTFRFFLSNDDMTKLNCHFPIDLRIAYFLRRV